MEKEDEGGSDLGCLWGGFCLQATRIENFRIYSKVLRGCRWGNPGLIETQMWQGKSIETWSYHQNVQHVFLLHLCVGPAILRRDLRYNLAENRRSGKQTQHVWYVLRLPFGGLNTWRWTETLSLVCVGYMHPQSQMPDNSLPKTHHLESNQLPTVSQTKNFVPLLCAALQCVKYSLQIQQHPMRTRRWRASSCAKRGDDSATTRGLSPCLVGGTTCGARYTLRETSKRRSDGPRSFL